MNPTYRILPEIGLVYVRYSGVIDARESLDVFQDYARDPDFRPGQKQLVDLSAVEGYNADFLEILKFQMEKAAVFMQGAEQTLIAYYAPHKTALDIAVIAARAWGGVSRVVASVQPDAAGALSVLGLPHDSIDALLADVSAM